MNDNEKPKVLPFKRKAAKMSLEEAEAAAQKSFSENAEAIALKKLADYQTQAENGEPCHATIKLIETMLEDAKAGKISGVATVAWNPEDKRFLTYFNVSREACFTHTFDSFALMQIGALSLLRYDLEEIAFYKQRAQMMMDVVSEIKPIVEAP